MQKGAELTYSSWPVLSQETLHVSSGHQLQQDEPWKDVQTDADTTHNVLMVELAVWTNSQQVGLLLSCKCKKVYTK